MNRIKDPFMTPTQLLSNPEVVRWCYEPLTAVSLKTTTSKVLLAPAFAQEVAWGNAIMGTLNVKQWTTRLCQNIAKEALIRIGRRNVRQGSTKFGSIGKKRYSPDLECDEFVYEVKGRSWTTTGTAGEKILGVPLKYGEIPRVYGKPLKIILVAYQEYEARACFGFGDLLDVKNQTQELSDSLAFFKTRNIEYLALTDILSQTGLPYGSWK